MSRITSFLNGGLDVNDAKCITQWMPGCRAGRVETTRCQMVFWHRKQRPSRHFTPSLRAVKFYQPLRSIKMSRNRRWRNQQCPDTGVFECIENQRDLFQRTVDIFLPLGRGRRFIVHFEESNNTGDREDGILTKGFRRGWRKYEIVPFV